MVKDRDMSSSLVLEQFLDKRRVYKGEEYTHTKFGGGFGKFLIKDEDMDKFMNLYTKVINDGGEQQYIVEYPRSVGPLCIDIDFNFPPLPNYEKRQYNDNHLKGIVNIINATISKFTKASPSVIEAYVTEKPKPSKDYDKNDSSKLKRYKDGFHVQYPKLPLSVELRHIIRYICIQEISDKGLFSDITFSNELDDVVDKSVIERNGWMMYGSKKQTGQRYEVTKVYNCEGKKINFNNAELPMLLCVRKFKEEDGIEPNRTDDEIFRIAKLRATNRNKMTKLKKKLDSKQILKVNEELDEDDSMLCDDDDDDDDEEENELSKEDLKKVEQLVSILSPHRGYAYNTWAEVGWCLRNIDRRLLTSFKQFSKDKLREYLEKNKNDEKKTYDPATCEYLWENARQNGNKLTIRSLYHWARTDNMKEYFKIMREAAKKELFLADSGNHYDVAQVVYKLYQSEFVCASISKNKWYEFQKHRWVFIDSAYTLKRKLSEDLSRQLMGVCGTFMTEGSDIEGPERDEFMRRSDNIRKVMDNLCRHEYKNKIVAECAQLFYDPEFEKKLDSNRDIIGFDNGVYDLVNGCFRDGTPEDFLTFSVGFRYKEYHMNHKYIKEIDDFFSKIQPEKDMKEFELTVFASHLDGHNKSQKFIMFTGFSGANGKSTSLEFLSKILGDYASSVPHTLLTRKRGSAGSATPELADKRGVRFIQINEPSKNDELEVGFLKELTGNDTIQARALYGDLFYYKPQFKFILPCNRLPRVDAVDGGTWRRLCPIPHDIQFIDHDRKIEDPTRQFYKDYDIDEKLDKWKQAGMWLLLKKYYPIYKNGLGKMIPAKVKEATDKYQKESDFYHEFLSENFDITKEMRDSENKAEILQDFRTFTQENFSGQGVKPGKRDLINYLENMNLKIRGTRIFGLRYKVIDDGQEDMMNDFA